MMMTKKMTRGLLRGQRSVMFRKTVAISSTIVFSAALSLSPFVTLVAAADNDMAINLNVKSNGSIKLAKVYGDTYHQGFNFQGAAQGTPKNSNTKYIVAYKTHRAKKKGKTRFNVDDSLIVIRYKNNKYEQVKEIKLNKAVGKKEPLRVILKGDEVKKGSNKLPTYYAVGHGNQITFDNISKRFFIPWSSQPEKAKKHEEPSLFKALNKANKYVFSFQLKEGEDGDISLASPKLQDVSGVFGKYLMHNVTFRNNDGSETKLNIPRTINGLSVGGCAGHNKRYIYAMIDQKNSDPIRTVVRAVVDNNGNISADGTNMLAFDIDASPRDLLCYVDSGSSCDPGGTPKRGGYEEQLRNYQNKFRNRSEYAGTYGLPSYVITHNGHDTLYTGRWISIGAVARKSEGDNKVYVFDKIYKMNVIGEYDLSSVPSKGSGFKQPNRVYYMPTAYNKVNNNTDGSKGSLMRGEMEDLFVNGHGNLFLVYNTPDDKWSMSKDGRKNVGKDPMAEDMKDKRQATIYRISGRGFPATNYGATCSGNTPSVSTEIDNNTTQQADTTSKNVKDTLNLTKGGR